MVEIIWSDNSVNNLESIAEYISLDSSSRAEKFVKKIYDFSLRLIEYPYSGRIIPEYNDETKREFIVGNYRIMYKIETNQILILAVIHGAQDFLNQN